MAETINTDEPFITILFTERITDEEKEQTIKTLLLPYITNKSNRFPSELLTKYVYKNPTAVVSESDSTWNTNIATLRTVTLENDDYTRDILKLLSKIERNIEVAKVQYDLMAEETHKLAKSVKKSKKQFEDLNSKTIALYSNFVSTLGIFVAISFSLFGAASLLKDIFNFGSNPTRLTVGTNIMMAGFFTILVYLLITGLMSGISRIINRTYDFNIFLFLIILTVSLSIISFGFCYSHKIFLSKPWIPLTYISGHFILLALLFMFILAVTTVLYKFSQKYYRNKNEPTPDN
ncbi:hypothetical protein QMA60_04780 [Leuconostoc suionicum]|uniref:hypothetical protein n=1 Tax=Leuconostoc suionicum TaxID=1511761 RepID=UPI001995539C|nr:hypothetical protein [Leuconostoc suionicum]MBC9702887.1 hypothetical protein [Leuconostoc sp.]MDI6497759.1 hypothetical protein [Leuconostoc suionicum]MDI6499831.1 hypothetical protein [Leuconostoc suionicum]MDI6502020.1 hypothetical protein [Leuconostoc suionicum]MDI6613906.1 hypothetical protein [Leuconostoc suionicum]